MNKTPFLLAIALFLFITTNAQEHHQKDYGTDNLADVVSMGIGFGFPYGGLGANVTVYPQKNIGLFGGVGYAFAGAGYNVGVKLRLLPNEGRSNVRPFFTAMYGYNAAIHVANNTDLDKMFYGPSIGAGIDIGSLVARKGYFSIAILVPIRNGDAQAYQDNLEQNYGVSFNSKLLPIAFSLGYHFILD